MVSPAPAALVCSPVCYYSLSVCGSAGSKACVGVVKEELGTLDFIGNGFVYYIQN